MLLNWIKSIKLATVLLLLSSKFKWLTKWLIFVERTPQALRLLGFVVREMGLEKKVNPRQPNKYGIPCTLYNG